MAKAKTIDDAALDQLLDDIAQTSRDPQRDLVIVLLSCKGGLRAQEIAGLTWRDVTDASGALSNNIVVPAAIAKKGHERTVPMHPMITEALTLLREAVVTFGLSPKGRSSVPVVLSSVGQARMSPNNLAQFMRRLYQRHGLEASSHSGRRTVITKLARAANEYGCSLFDVQRVAGHRDIQTTEAYVEHSDGIGDLMRSL